MMSMSNPLTQTEAAPVPDRHAPAAPGSRYTPAAFARFVAARMVATAALPAKGAIRILDPAVGDGVLLDALVRSLPEQVWPRLQVFGFDANAEAIRIVASRLHRTYPAIGVHLEQQDFLSHVIEAGDAADLFSGLDPDSAFQFIIANPPHVRTRIMGDEEMAQLAEHFGVTGSIDLYYPFLLGIAEVLAEDGVAGVITANSDLTGTAGESVREALLTRFRIQHVWDLGGISAFDAAGAPAVLVAGGRHRQAATAQAAATGAAPAIACTTIHQTDAGGVTLAEDVFSAFDASDDTVVAIADGRCFHVRHGVVDNGGDVRAAWRLATGTGGQARED